MSSTEETEIHVVPICKPNGKIRGWQVNITIFLVRDIELLLGLIQYCHCYPENVMPVSRILLLIGKIISIYHKYEVCIEKFFTR